MTLKDQITDDMKTAMRARDTVRLGTIRLLLAAIKQREVDERIVLDDTAINAVLDKMLKQRRDSIAQFRAGGRDDLAAKESAEVAVLSTYMPRQLDASQIEVEIATAIAASGAAGPQDMGKVMSILKAKLAGKADMAAISAGVKAALATGRG